MALHKKTAHRTSHLATIKKSQKRMPTRKELSRIGVNKRGEDINISRKVLPAAKRSNVKNVRAAVKKVTKKQSIVGKLQTFSANRNIKLARNQARLTGKKGIHSNKAKLAIARRSASGLQQAIIKRNKAKHK